jgi:uncharacterized protein YehS (DUF1456 family)
MISYSWSVWWEAIDRQFVIKPFTTLQRQVALRITKAYRTLSIEASNILSNLMPIDLYLKQRAVQYFIKNGITNELTEFYLQDLNIDLSNIQKPFKTDELPHFALRNKANIVSEITDKLIAFTDGSKSSRGVGAAYCLLDNNIIIKKAKYKLAAYCSVFQSELLAVLKAIEYKVH